MRKIYVMLSHTGTILSRIIRLNTGAEYTHVSISLDEALKKMYSFGRINPYIAFLGGFVRESKNFGTFKRFKNTQVSIYELEIRDDQYEKIEEIIKYIKKNKSKYRFNILGLALAGINKKRNKPDTFYCAEFVKHILTQGGINVDNLPEVIKPEDFKKLENANLIYKGYLRNYTVEKLTLLNYLKTIASDKTARI